MYEGQAGGENCTKQFTIDHILTIMFSLGGKF